MIDRILIHTEPEAVLNQGNGKLGIKSTAKGHCCADFLKVDFDESYSIEIKERTKGETVLVLTAGGIHRVMDLQTLQHLVAMTY